MKKVVFIGGGASTLCSAVLLKKREPSFEVVIVEKDKKLGKKLSMTGGGKCNIAPLEDNPSVYNALALELIENTFKNISLSQYLSLLKEIGFDTKTIKDYGYYPIHESAPQAVKNLYHQINKLGIKVIYDEFLDYESKNNKVTIKLKEQNIEADYLIIATGGLSKEMRNVFENHNVKVTKTYPGLCPVRLKENVASLFGCRFEATITLFYKKDIVKQCYGEVQFKKDGLSGIPVLNMSSLISRKMIDEDINMNDYQISIGLPEQLHVDILGKTVEEAFLMLFKEEYANYMIEKHDLNKKEIINQSLEKIILNIVQDERFTVESLYDFKDGQVTVGGVSLDEINKDFALKITTNVYVIGEALNVDGICGGYNLRFAIASGFIAVHSLVK
ncbi:MAG: aminoacetone oxidase family FAD-binding enzyme [Bacilli bacterium]|nr:aminoacetone oxidase family FAD-binding enzyme [Bacilli bacterium]